MSASHSQNPGQSPDGDPHLSRRHSEERRGLFYVGHQHQLLPDLAQFLTRRVAVILGLVLLSGAASCWTAKTRPCW